MEKYCKYNKEKSNSLMTIIRKDVIMIGINVEVPR